MCSINFWWQQDYNSLFKGSIGHVTSCARGLLVSYNVQHVQDEVLLEYVIKRGLCIPWQVCCMYIPKIYKIKN